MNQTSYRQLRIWLDRNQSHIRSNKKLTPISREIYVLLYEYAVIDQHKFQKNDLDETLLKAISFCVLALPDIDLLKMIRTFDIYQKEFPLELDNYNHPTNPKDFTKKDHHNLKIILTFYTANKFTDTLALVTKTQAFELNDKYHDAWHEQSLRKISQAAKQNKLTNPILLITINQQLYLEDCFKKIRYH